MYSPTLIIFASTTVTVNSTYCLTTITDCSLSDTVNNFILAGEAGTQINDQGTGCTTGGFSDRSSQSVSLYNNMVYTALVATQYSSSEQVAIWIDFNNNFAFESSERVALQALVSTTNTAVTMSIPSAGAGAIPGVHRMRVSVAFSVTPHPCSVGVTYGETHDYTVNILTYTPRKTKRSVFSEINFAIEFPF